MQCNTNPTAGCGDASIVAEIKIQTNTIVTHLDEVKTAIENLQAQGEECCEETNGNLQSIEAKLDTLIANSSECCTTQTSLFEQMVDLLQRLLDCECPTTSTTTSTTTTTLCIPCPPAETTTTTEGEPAETTTTTEGEGAGTTTTTCEQLFAVNLGIGNTEYAACADESETYYMDTEEFGIGSFIYYDVCGTIPIDTLYVIFSENGIGYNCSSNEIISVTGNAC